MKVGSLLRWWWLSGLVALGCAGRSAEPLLTSPAAEKTPHAWVAGDEPAARAVCEAFVDAGERRDCEIITTGRNFDVEALRVCQESAVDAPERSLRCLEVVAERHFTVRSIATCEGFGESDRNDCLEVLADRRLSQAQVDECRAKTRSHRSIRCLARARNHVFDPEMLHHVAIAAASTAPELEAIPYPEGGPAVPDEALVDARERVRHYNHEQMLALLERTREEVQAAFPSAQLEPVDQDVVFNFAGGALGHYRMLYCSRREYLIVFGTPLGVNGYSGRYIVDVHDWTLTGEMRIHRVGDFSPTVLAPGSWAKLLADDSKIYTAEADTYMLEYARGRISSAFKFGITAPARNVSRDFVNMRGQIRSCLDTAVHNGRTQRRRMRRLEANARKTRRAIRSELRAEP